MTNPFVAPDRDAPRLSHIVDSPIGRLLLLGDGHALTGLWMIDAERGTALDEHLADVRVAGIPARLSAAAFQAAPPPIVALRLA